MTGDESDPEGSEHRQDFQAQVARGRDLLEVGQIDAGLLLTHTGLLRRYSEAVDLARSGVATPCE